MPSPPPRKVKPTVWLKEVHAKQLGSLQAREQQLLDIIEDIRSYSKQRADIERSYGQALLKLSAQFLGKKDFFTSVEQTSEGEYRTVHAAWKACLEETEKAGSTRVKSSEVYVQTVSERCKVLKTHKSMAVKRALDQLNSLQADLSQSVKEFGVAHKQYTDDEIVAFEARTKANIADQRLTNKDTSLFSSVSTLKKSQVKTFAKMDAANARSTSSRNGYLLELSAVNAHTGKLHTKHIPTLFKVLDDGVYDELSSCISMIGQTEVDSCTGILSTHSRVASTCEKVTPQYNLDVFLQANPVFSEQITFTFEPVQNDPVSHLSKEFSEEQRLQKETRNWARKVAKETRSLADLHDKISQLTNRGATGDPVLEAELQKLQSLVRRSDIAKLKAEARLDLLRTADMPVDDVLAEATTEHESQPADIHSLASFSGSHHSTDTFDSYSDNTLDRSQSSNHRPSHSSLANQHQGDDVSTSQDSALSTVRVIYNYSAVQADELSLVEGELLSILDHGSGDGWLRACNSNSEVGMVPENYIEPYEDVVSPGSPSNETQPSDYGVQQQQQGYDAHQQQQGYDAHQQQQGYDAHQQQQGYDAHQQQQGYDAHQQQQGYDGQQQQQGYDVQQQQQAYSETSSQQSIPQPNASAIGYVRALYDYQADGEDEISFAAGEMITLLSRDENGIDDGYWKGEVNGVSGMFPSLVVEEVEDLHTPSHAQFSTWEEPITHHTSSQQHSEPIEQTTPGSYNIPQHNTPEVYDRSAPLPSIPDEPDMKELYPSHVSPRIRRRYDAVPEEAPPPTVNRASKPGYASRPNSIPLPPKPTVDYSRKPSVEHRSPPLSSRASSVEQRSPPLSSGTPSLEQRSPPLSTNGDSAPKPFGQRYERSSMSVEVPRRPPPAVPATRPNSLPQPRSQSAIEQSTRTQHSHYEENRSPQPVRWQGGEMVGEDVEGRKFRQMQPVPHQYYIEHGGRPSDGRTPEYMKDRSSSNRSFASMSSGDSQDDKQTPIRIPGRRHLTSNTPSDPPTPVMPLSVREASRLMPQGLVNPSYRVATMAVDVMPNSGRSPSAGGPPKMSHSGRPSPSRRRGGLPGHVRQGIVQGRQTLSQAASDSPSTNQPMRRQPAKSETAV